MLSGWVGAALGVLTACRSLGKHIWRVHLRIGSRMDLGVSEIGMAETDFDLTVCDRTMHDQLMLRFGPFVRNLLCISGFCKPHMKSDSDSLLI